MLGRLKELTELNGVSGNEKAVRKYLKEFAINYADEVFNDAMGNLYAHKKGDGKRVMACAHMDEVGMMVRGIRSDGLLAYQAANLDARVVVGKRVAIGEKSVPGVIGSKPIHLQSEEEFYQAYNHDSLYIDIGASDKADAQKYVSVGDYVAFTTKFEEFGDGMIRCKALDDRVGCAIVTELLKNDYDCDFYAVFTVQEELGLRGSRAAAYNVKPDIALIFEGTTANDMPKVEGHEHVTRVHGGAAITFMDGGTVTRPQMFDALKRCAKENGIRWQLRQGTRGRTDAGEIHLAGDGAITGGISVPCRYIHSPVTATSKEDIICAFELADAFLRQKYFERVLEAVCSGK